MISTKLCGNERANQDLVEELILPLVPYLKVDESFMGNGEERIITRVDESVVEKDQGMLNPFFTSMNHALISFIACNCFEFLCFVGTRNL